MDFAFYRNPPKSEVRIQPGEHRPLCADGPGLDSMCLELVIKGEDKLEHRAEERGRGGPFMSRAGT